MPRPPAPGLILTVYGAFVRPMGGWLAVADLVALLRGLGQPEPVVRSATSRMKKGGLLRAEARGGVAGYALTDVALAILGEGDQRIFVATTPVDPSDGWVIAVFSVPERHRDRRYRLRSRLTGLGFGQVASGVWLAPRRVLPATRRLLEHDRLARYVNLFEGAHVGFVGTETLVARTWDLTSVARAYELFERQHRRVAERWRRSSDGTDADAFADYVVALSDWRRLPYLDPGLPAALLPPDWPGERARGLFAELADRLADRAAAHVRATAGSKVTV